MLLFLHGFLGAPSDWDPVISHLPLHSCLALELPGHGATPFTPHFHDTIPRFDAPISAHRGHQGLTDFGDCLVLQ